MRVRGAPEPEDVLGEVFMVVVRNLSRFEGDERKCRAWILTIAHNRMIDDYRRRRLRPFSPAPHDELEGCAPPGDAESEALNSAEAGRAVAMMRRLSPDQQDVLLLRLVAGLTVQEVAGVLGRSPGAVKALQRRGLAALRRQLDAQGVPI